MRRVKSSHPVLSLSSRRHSSVGVGGAHPPEQRADPNRANADGITLQNLAYVSGRWDTVALLPRHGATSPIRSKSRAFQMHFRRLIIISPSEPRPPHVCPCCSEKSIDECLGKKKPYPLKYISIHLTACGLAKTYWQCCYAREALVFEDWDEQRQQIRYDYNYVSNPKFPEWLRQIMWDVYAPTNGGVPSPAARNILANTCLKSRTFLEVSFNRSCCRPRAHNARPRSLTIFHASMSMTRRLAARHSRENSCAYRRCIAACSQAPSNADCYHRRMGGPSVILARPL